MSKTKGSAAGAKAPPESAAIRRRVVDLAALDRAKPTARIACAKLMAVLDGGGSSAELEHASKAALTAVGMLWEASARVNE